MVIQSAQRKPRYFFAYFPLDQSVGWDSIRESLKDIIQFINKELGATAPG